MIWVRTDCIIPLLLHHHYLLLLLLLQLSAQRLGTAEQLFRRLKVHKAMPLARLALGSGELDDQEYLRATLLVGR